LNQLSTSLHGSYEEKLLFVCLLGLEDFVQLCDGSSRGVCESVASRLKGPLHKGEGECEQGDFLLVKDKPCL
jgi:hypothetical protein